MPGLLQSLSWVCRYLPGPGPSPGPSPPSPPQCPQPAATGAGCSYRNQTAITGAASFAKLSVSLNDYGACCRECNKNPRCHTAAQTHGPEDASFDFCWLYVEKLSSLKTTTDNSTVCPRLALVLVPN